MSQQIEVVSKEGAGAREGCSLTVYNRFIELVRDHPDRFMVQSADAASSCFTLGTMMVSEGKKRYLSVEFEFKRNGVVAVGFRLAGLEGSYPRFRYLPKETYLLMGRVEPVAGRDALSVEISDGFERGLMNINEVQDFVCQAEIRLPEWRDYKGLPNLSEADFNYFFGRRQNFANFRSRLAEVHGDFETILA